MDITILINEAKYFILSSLSFVIKERVFFIVKFIVTILFKKKIIVTIIQLIIT